MSVVYKVNAKAGLNVRSGPGTGNSVVKALPYNTTVKSDGKTENGWIYITAPSQGWCSGTYLTKVSESAPPPPVSAPTTPPSVNIAAQTGTAAIQPSAPTSASQGPYKRMTHKYLRAHGCPPQFNLNTDIQYMNEVTPGVGRVFGKTMLSNPTIISICPGSVDYLPQFNQNQKESFFETVLGSASDGAVRGRINADKGTNSLDGKLYEFQQKYSDYINNVNYLCRTMSMLMDIGDEYMPFSKKKLKTFDYAWWNSPESWTDASDSKSIFGEVTKNMRKMASTAVNDESYVHFFVTNQGTSVNEDISTNTASSVLEEAINSSSLNSISRNLEFLFGGAIGSLEDSDLEADLNAIFQNNEGYIKSFSGLAKNYFKGGRLVFPQMIDGVNYQKSMSCSLKCVSPSGNKLSVFLRCMVPAMFMLAMALPKQMSGNMYTYPYIVRVFQKGWFNSDLAVITNLNIQRGGGDNTSWSIDGLPTEVDITFDIMPLYTDLMVSTTSRPFLASQNTSLMEYLAVLAGVDLKMNNIGAKISMVTTSMANKFTDIPANLGRGVVENLADKVGKILQIHNR